MAAAKRQRVISPPSAIPFASSPSLSAIRSSPLATGSLPSYPVTSSPFTSSPILSCTQRGSSPEFFDDFEYNEGMDADFRRIDLELAEAERSRHNCSPPSLNDGISSSDSPPIFAGDEKTWVVFRGKIPGIYEDAVSAAMQTQGYSDAFQRVFPDRNAARAAWKAYVRDKIYPDYGKAPWVVFLGRKCGISIKVTELEASVKGYHGAIFRSCSSVTEGQIKYHLFAERVARMFTGPNPFPTMPQQLEGRDFHGTVAADQRIAPIPVTPKHLPPQVAESSNAASKRNASYSSLASSARKLKVSRPSDGWYVAFNAVLPGTYYGIETLGNAKPEPGGFCCVPNKGCADLLFHDLTMSGSIIWADERE